MSNLIYVHPEIGDRKIKYIIIGEAPGATEERVCRPFYGKYGQKLRTLLTDIGFDLEECYLTNVVKVRPEGNRTPLKAEVRSWLPILKQELCDYLCDDVQVITLGETAAYAIEQIKKEDFPNWDALHNNVIYLPHPAYVWRFGNENTRENFYNTLKTVAKRGFYASI